MTIAENIFRVRKLIEKAVSTAALKTAAHKPELIAVSKTHSEKAVREALEAGQRIFGENRVQEAQKKFSKLRDEHPDLKLHLIGHLQKNKARAAVETFDVIQTLDGRELADALAKAIKQTGRNPEIYIQVNIGNEAQKSGVAPDLEQIKDLLEYCRDKCGLNVTGLMCIPPEEASKNVGPRSVKNYFAKLKEFADALSLPHVSMGMSSDFREAIAEGATEVRIGTAIFGQRGAEPDAPKTLPFLRLLTALPQR